MFAIKEAQECVISEYSCESDWRRNSLIPSACRKTPQHIFQLAVKVDIQSARQDEKQTMCPLLGLIFSGERYNQLLPSQTSAPITRVETVTWFLHLTRDIILFFLMFTFLNKGDTLDFFSLSGLSFMFLFQPSRGLRGLVCFALWSDWVPFTFGSAWGGQRK